MEKRQSHVSDEGNEPRISSKHPIVRRYYLMQAFTEWHEIYSVYSKKTDSFTADQAYRVWVQFMHFFLFSP